MAFYVRCEYFTIPAMSTTISRRSEEFLLMDVGNFGSQATFVNVSRLTVVLFVHFFLILTSFCDSQRNVFSRKIVVSVLACLSTDGLQVAQGIIEWHLP